MLVLHFSLTVVYYYKYSMVLSFHLSIDLCYYLHSLHWSPGVLCWNLLDYQQLMPYSGFLRDFRKWYYLFLWSLVGCFESNVSVVNCCLQTTHPVHLYHFLLAPHNDCLRRLLVKEEFGRTLRWCRDSSPGTSQKRVGRSPRWLQSRSKKLIWY